MSLWIDFIKNFLKKLLLFLCSSKSFNKLYIYVGLIDRGRIAMAFNLFKKKAKKDKPGAGNLPPKPKLEPLAKPDAPVPGVPEIPPMNPPISAPGDISPPPMPNIPKDTAPSVQPGSPVPEIPPIKVPEMPPAQAPKEPIPPIHSAPDVAAQVPPMGEGDAIKVPEIDKPFMTPIDEEKPKEFGAPIKEDAGEVIPFAKEEDTGVPTVNTGDDELPSFPESGSAGGVGEVPSPPAYFSRMGDIREDVGGDSGLSHRLLKKPIFVEVNDYRKIIEEVDSIKKDSKKSKDVTRSLEDLKTKTENKLKVWNKELEKIQRNLVFMDKVLFEESG